MFTTFSPLPSPMINNNINQEVPKHSLPPLSQIITSMPSYQPYPTPQQQQLPTHQLHQSGVASFHQPEPVKREDFSPTIVPQQQQQQQPRTAGPASPKYSSKVVDKCTCRNEGNHIPRPRNAFILFRQQHHQSVLDEGNVIRTNPDVSRELGKRWRDLSPDEKDYWNKLAEEEKKRHAEKYPGYRYIPRRFGKKGSCPFCKNKQQKQQQTEQQQSTPPTSTSTTPDDVSKASSSSEEHAIAQSFLSLRNQQPHPSYNPVYYQPHPLNNQPQPVQFVPNTFQSPVFYQPQHQPQIPIQAPIQPLQPGNTNNSNYTINRLPELKKVNVGVKKEQSEELESPSDKSKISFANILN